MEKQNFQVRRFRHGEDILLRSLRLKALQSDPHSYWDTLAEAESFGDNYWLDLALKLLSPNGPRMFILEQDGIVVGFTYGIRKEAGEYRVAGLWVDPAYRGQKYGRALVREVVSWAKSQPDMTSIRLWSHTDEIANFYKKIGFKPSGAVRTHPSDGRQIIDMEWCA